MSRSAGDPQSQGFTEFVLKSLSISCAAALGALALIVPAQAQQAAQQPDESVVGAPELRDFQLPGTRVVPPPAAEQPAERGTPPTAQPSRGPAAEPVTIAPPPPSTIQNRPPARVAAPASQPSAAQALPSPAPAEPAPQFEAAPADTFAAPAAVPVPAEDPALAPSGNDQGNMMWIALGLAVVGLVAFAAYRRRRSPALAHAADAPVLRQAPDPVPAPAAAKGPAPAPVAALKAQVANRAKAAPSAGRPWIELEFQPDRMVATDTEAAVHFELAIRNTGQSHARNVRVIARMFNASPQQEQEIGAFFEHPAKTANGPGAAIVPHGTETRTRSTVSLPRESARVYFIGDKPIFVPVVAVTILYEWDEWGVKQTGQTSRSYVVGVEPKTPSEKMGAFRLDLGPRIYRSVGQRQSQLARIV